MLPGRSARAGGSDAGHASTALRRPPEEKVPFSPLRRQYGGVPAGRQPVDGPARLLNWTDSDGLAAPDVIAGGGTRTHTDLRPGAFEAPSSTIPTLRRAGHCLNRLKRSHRTSAARVGRRAGGEYIPSTLVGNLSEMVPSKGSNDDRDLVGRARRGDREAFTQLIVQYQVPLYNMALRMVGRPDDAADIAQEAFLRAWEKIRTLREAPFKSWLFQIAANLCYDHFRRGRRYGVMPDDDQTSTSNVVGLGIATPDRQERAEANERTRLVRDSIAALDHDMRIAIVLRDVNGMAYDEIAAVLRVPLGTVKSRIARARAQVQEHLQRHPDFFPTTEDAHAE